MLVRAGEPARAWCSSGPKSPALEYGGVLSGFGCLGMGHSRRQQYGLAVVQRMGLGFSLEILRESVRSIVMPCGGFSVSVASFVLNINTTGLNTGVHLNLDLKI